MIDVLVIGAGMYVCGRGTDSYGTILPALFKAKKAGKVNAIKVACTSEKSSKLLLDKVGGLNALMGTDFQVEVGPTQGKDRDFWKKSLLTMPKGSGVIISTPDHLHFEMAKASLEAKLHTMVVKPLTPTLKEAVELSDIVEKNNTYGVVEFHKRFDRSNRLLKNAIEKGDIGKPLYFIVEYSQKRHIPEVVFKDWAHTVNIFQYLGVHYVDIIYFATRAKPLKLNAVPVGNTLGENGVNTPDSVLVSIEWEKDGHRFFSNFHTNWIDPSSTTSVSDQKIKVIGTNGRFEADQKERGVQVVRHDSIEDINPDFCRFYKDELSCESPEGYGIDSIVTFIEDLIDIQDERVSVKDLETIRPTFKESLTSVQVIEAVNKSLELNGEWVICDEL